MKKGTGGQVIAPKIVERLVAKAIALGADALQVEHKDRCEEVFAMKGPLGFGIASLRSSSPDAASLRKELHWLVSRKHRISVGGSEYELRCRIYESFLENAFWIELRPPLNPAAGGRLPAAPDAQEPFTILQGQYLAFIAAYTLVMERPPAEADMQRYFNVTPPSVHQMVLTLEKRGLIARTPGQPRSIKVLAPAAQLPKLEDRPHGSSLGPLSDILLLSRS